MYISRAYHRSIWNYRVFRPMETTLLQVTLVSVCMDGRSTASESVKPMLMVLLSCECSSGGNVLVIVLLEVVGLFAWVVVLCTSVWLELPPAMVGWPRSMRDTPPNTQAYNSIHTHTHTHTHTHIYIRMNECINLVWAFRNLSDQRCRLTHPQDTPLWKRKKNACILKICFF